MRRKKKPKNHTTRSKHPHGEQEIQVCSRIRRSRGTVNPGIRTPKYPASQNTVNPKFRTPKQRSPKILTPRELTSHQKFRTPKQRSSKIRTPRKRTSQNKHITPRLSSPRIYTPVRGRPSERRSASVGSAAPWAFVWRATANSYPKPNPKP